MCLHKKELVAMTFEVTHVYTETWHQNGNENQP
jgi:hypothetical protein